MNKTLAESRLYAETLRDYFAGREPTSVQPFFFPPFTVLNEITSILSDTCIKVGAQNMHWEDYGAYTGEISPFMIKDCKSNLVELGHSERREYFNETDYTVNKKVLAALKHDIVPLICIGENSNEKEFGVAREFVIRQLKIALNSVPKERASEIILAYEPVWAIGEGGVPADPTYAEEIHQALKTTLVKLYDVHIANKIPVLYGGSVNLKNVGMLLAQPNIDGVFVGRAAWNPQNLITLIEIAESI